MAGYFLDLEFIWVKQIFYCLQSHLEYLITAPRIYNLLIYNTTYLYLGFLYICPKNLVLKSPKGIAFLKY